MEVVEGNEATMSIKMGVVEGKILLLDCCIFEVAVIFFHWIAGVWCHWKKFGAISSVY